MAEHFFGFGSGRVLAATEDKVERVLAKAEGVTADARLVTFTDPAQGPRYWFGVQNMGAPFDGAHARAALAALAAAGLWADHYGAGEEGLPVAAGTGPRRRRPRRVLSTEVV